MVKVNRINISQVEGGYSDDSDKRPNGEMALYNDDNGGFDLVIHDGVNSTNLNKVLGKGKLYGHGADSADGNGYDTIKLIPDIPAYNGGSDQYIIIDPTGPNHIHIRAGGTIDNSNSELILGGENSNVKIGAGSNPQITVESNSNSWIFGTDGTLTFPDNSTQNTAALPLNHNNYVICKNGDSLAAKYAAATLLTPGGNPLSATNRATLVIMPGNYSLSEELVIDTDYVDILGLGSIKLERGCVTAVTLSINTINITANDTRVKGISVEGQNFKIGNNLPNQIIEDCIGTGYGSFGDFGSTSSGTFINCVGGNASFNHFGTSSGLFINCSCGWASFGASGYASGSFINCTGGYNSFGGYGIANGSFKNCICTSSYGFGGYGTANGYFVGCSSGPYGFGGIGSASGSFIDCVGGQASFGGAFAPSGNEATGFFKNCSASASSYGTNGVTSGVFLGCSISGTTVTFPTLSGSGKYRLCIDGYYDVINANGT